MYYSKNLIYQKIVNLIVLIITPLVKQTKFEKTNQPPLIITHK